MPRLPILPSLVLLAAFPASSLSAATISINPNKTYQTMTGWETTPRGWELDKNKDSYDPTWLAHKAAILDRLVNDLGINRVRLEIKSGMENPVDYWTPFINQQLSYTDMKAHWHEKLNDNGDPHSANLGGFQFAELDFYVENILLPIKQRVAANRESLSVNLTYVDFASTTYQGTLSHAANPEEYAELVAVCFEHLKTKYNIEPDAFEIILEPDNTHWRGTEIGRGLVAAVNRLKARGFSPAEIIAPSNANAAGAVTYFDEMVKVDGVLEHLTTFSYHRYGGATTGNLEAIAERAERYNLMTGMLEHLTGNVDELHTDLTLVNNSAWQQWGIAAKSTDTSMPSYYYVGDISDPAKPVVRMADRARRLQQYFRYIRRKATRIEATSTDVSNFRPVAFINENGQYAVVVRTGSADSFTVEDLPAGRYGISYSGGSASHVSRPDVTITKGESITTSNAAGEGAVTVYAKPPSDSGECSGGANPDQGDEDDDGIGDACDLCRSGVTMTRSRLVLLDVDRSLGEHQLRMSGELKVGPNFPGLNSAVAGVRVVVQDLSRVDPPVLLVDVGPGSEPSACGPGEGWRSSPQGTTYCFRTLLNAVTDDSGTWCLGPGSAEGVFRVCTWLRNGTVGFVVRGQHGSYDVGGPLGMTFILQAGDASAAAATGLCGDVSFPPDACTAQRTAGAVSRVRCR